MRAPALALMSRQTCARLVLVLAILAAIPVGPGAAVAARAQSLEREVEATLRSLYETTPQARELAPAARGILVFPDIFRENYYYTFGVQSGNGALLVGSKVVGYYTASSITYGLQAGALPFASILFLMTDSALTRLEHSGGWEVGKDPRVDVLPVGTPETSTMDTQGGTMKATSGTMTTRTTARPDTYAFVLGEAGLMTGVGRQGWKITKVSVAAAAAPARIESP
jgi:lipid-binding SYLF domain-containing protein